MQVYVLKTLGPMNVVGYGVERVRPPFYVGNDRKVMCSYFTKARLLSHLQNNLFLAAMLAEGMR